MRESEGPQTATRRARRPGGRRRLRPPRPPAGRGCGCSRRCWGLGGRGPPPPPQPAAPWLSRDFRPSPGGQRFRVPFGQARASTPQNLRAWKVGPDQWSGPTRSLAHSGTFLPVQFSSWGGCHGRAGEGGRQGVSTTYCGPAPRRIRRRLRVRADLTRLLLARGCRRHGFKLCGPGESQALDSDA